MISYNKKKLFPLLCLILVACFAVISAGCGSSSNSGGKKVAVSFANSSASWQKNGQTIKTSLENFFLGNRNKYIRRNIPLR